MILYILSIVMVLEGDSLFSGKINQAELSSKGISSGFLLEKISGEVKGETVSDAAGEYFAVDGSVYYRDKLIITRENSFVRLERYKGYTLALFIPQQKIFVLSNGRIKDSLDIDIKGVSDIKTHSRTIYLFAGGDIYTITLSGVIKKFASFPVKNITSIIKHNGRYYVTTSEPGRVYEGTKNKWRVFYDPDLTEINAIGFSGDTMFVSGNLLQGENVQGKVLAVYSGEEVEVYKGTGIISGSMTWRGFICGEGEDGQVAVFHIDGFTLIQDLPEKEITEIHQEGDEIVICTGKPAGVYRMRKIKSKDGYYTSKVIDGGMGVKWGRIYWNGGGKVRIEYRSGRTSRPDSSWTEWKEYRVKLISEDRYAQLRFYLLTGRDRINSIKIYYQPVNHPPRIKEYGVLPPGVGYGNAENSPFDREMMEETEKAKWEGLGFTIPDGSFTVKRGNLRCIWWNATDEDGDRLVYSLYIKKNKGKYKLLADDIKGNAYFVDVTTFSEGDYTLKLVAKDFPTSFYPDSDNVEMDLLVDNTSPEVKILGLKNGWLTGEVEDRLSPIYMVFYKFENGDWFAALPKDGVYDQKKEGFKFYIPKDEKGCAIKAEDAMGNFRIIPVEVK